MNVQFRTDFRDAVVTAQSYSVSTHVSDTVRVKERERKRKAFRVIIKFDLAKSLKKK